MSVKIVRHTNDPLTSVYRGTPHLGLVHHPLPERPTYTACATAPLCDRLPSADFAAEAEAIAYLTDA